MEEFEKAARIAGYSNFKRERGRYCHVELEVLYQGYLLGKRKAGHEVILSRTAGELIHYGPAQELTVLAAQPQASAAQSAPAGEREALQRLLDDVRDVRNADDVAFGWDEAAEYFGAAWRTQSAGVPEGWKLVPVEPTAEMRAAGSKFDYLCNGIYQAMLAAAPAQPAAQESAVPALTEKEREDLLEFHEAVCCDADHRVEKDGMRRLAEIGAVESVGFGKHRLTEFGVYLLGIAPKAAQDQGEVHRLREAEELLWLAQKHFGDQKAIRSGERGASDRQQAQKRIFKWLDARRMEKVAALAASTGQEVKP